MPVFIERYFRKSRPEDLTFQDLQAFLRQGLEENQNLEYKPRGLLVDQNDRLRKDDDPAGGFPGLAKVVAGFANAEGGLLVLGVKEKPEKYKGTVVRIRPGQVSPLPPDRLKRNHREPTNSEDSISDRRHNDHPC